MMQPELDVDGLLDGLVTGDGDSPIDPQFRDFPFSQKSTGPTGPIYLDIETIPDLSREHSYGLDPVPTIDPAAIDSPGRLMSAEEFISQSLGEMAEWSTKHNPPREWLDSVIAAENGSARKGGPRKGALDLIATIAGRENAAAAARAAQIKEMSLTPEFCRIVAIGLAVGDSDPGTWFADTEVAEREMLAVLWDWLGKLARPIVGFNVLRFDLPAIFVRSAILGVMPTRRFSLKPWDGDVIDLMAVRFPSGSKAIGQKRLARALQFEDEAGAELDGSQVYEQFQAGEREKILQHVRSDVIELRRLHGAYKGFFCN